MSMLLDPYRFVAPPPGDPVLLLSFDEELLEPSALLLSGDATDGDDRLKLSGDMA